MEGRNGREGRRERTHEQRVCTQLRNQSLQVLRGVLAEGYKNPKVVVVQMDLAGVLDRSVKGSAALGNRRGQGDTAHEDTASQGSTEVGIE